MHIHEQWWLQWTSQWWQDRPLTEHVYCVAITFKMTEQIEQWICIKFYFELENSSMETIQMIHQVTAMGNWKLASSWQNASSCIMCRVEFLVDTSNHPGDSLPLQPKFGALWLLAFPKTKITFEKEEISHCWWDSGKYNGVADGNQENFVWSQGAHFEGDWGVISYVQFFLYLTSFSINVSIFHSTWLATFWTDPTFWWQNDSNGWQWVELGKCLL